jgi:hypothetical protein
MQPAAIRNDDATTAAGRWVPLVAVIGVITVVVGGAQVFGRAVTPNGGGILHVGAVALQPPPGWDVESVTTSPAEARLHRGAVVLDVSASGPQATGPASIAVRFVEQTLRPTLSQLLPAPPELVVLPSGASAARIAYVGVTREGSTIEGVVTAIAGASSSVTFDAAAPRGELIAVADDLQRMIEGAMVP